MNTCPKCEGTGLAENDRDICFMCYGKQVISPARAHYLFEWWKKNHSKQYTKSGYQLNWLISKFPNIAKKFGYACDVNRINLRNNELLNEFIKAGANPSAMRSNNPQLATIVDLCVALGVMLIIRPDGSGELRRRAD